MKIQAKGRKNQIIHAIIDEDDYEEVSKRNWYVNSNGYVYCEIRSDGKTIHKMLLHRFVMMDQLIFNKKSQVDHKNMNPLDCRKGNLRLCNNQRNTFNQPKRTGAYTSKYKGVCWCKKVKKWRAVIMKDNKQYYLGTYTDSKLAALAYNKASIEMFGEFARINEI